MNPDRIYLTVFAADRQAIALYEKFGFIPEGRSRESMFVGGAYTDEIFMGILSNETIRREVEKNGIGH